MELLVCFCVCWLGSARSFARFGNVMSIDFGFSPKTTPRQDNAKALGYNATSRTGRIISNAMRCAHLCAYMEILWIFVELKAETAALEVGTIYRQNLSDNCTLIELKYINSFFTSVMSNVMHYACIKKHNLILAEKAKLQNYKRQHHNISELLILQPIFCLLYAERTNSRNKRVTHGCPCAITMKNALSR